MILLDITLTTSWIVGIIIVLLAIALILRGNFSDLKAQRDYQQTKVAEHESKVREQEFQFQAKFAEWNTQKAQRELEYEQSVAIYKTSVHTLAQEKFEQFKEVELAGYRKIYAEQASVVAKGLLQEWKIVEEQNLRRDAVVRSMGVNLGKITEHLIPFSEYFTQFNPRDARFIGSPIDLIVFDGISDKKELVTIHFVEVKSGTGNLSTKQKKIRDAIENNRIEWLTINVGGFDWEFDEEQQKAQDEPTAT